LRLQLDNRMTPMFTPIFSIITELEIPISALFGNSLTISRLETNRPHSDPSENNSKNLLPLYHIARVSDPVAQADEQLFCARRPDNGPQSEKAAALSPRQATLKWLDISRTSTLTVLINVLHTRLRGSTDFDPSDLLATGLGIAGKSQFGSA